MNQLPFKRILIIGVISILGIFLSAKQKPNIVLMFIDDMGYGDIGPFGNKINQTPHLDRMAEEGNGSPNYISEMIPDNQTMEMEKIGNQWTATIKLDPKAKRIDFFSNHRKTLRYKESPHRTYMSSPYTRVNLK